MTLVSERTTSGMLREVERDLLRETQGMAIEWYGRAATALYRAYQIARRITGASEDAEVILPSISCATPANAALLAGITPRFADIDLETGMPTLEAIQQRWTANTCAVVFIHLFGQTADLRDLAEWCRERRIILIEDSAQALGALLPNGAPAGSIGDLCVYSFNPTKILECGGGALLIRSRELGSVSTEVSAQHPLPKEIDDAKAQTLGLSYRNLHHSLVALARERATGEIASAFLKVQPAFGGLYLRRMKDESALANAWPRLATKLAHRRKNAEKYDDILSNGPWKLLSRWRESGVCWRYSVLVNFPEKLTEFSEAVRRDGFHVSNLYWPVNDFFRPQDSCPAANDFARRIVNLWVDDSVGGQWVERCARSMLKNAERFT